jgi:hypothetical protein
LQINDNHPFVADYIRGNIVAQAYLNFYTAEFNEALVGAIKAAQVEYAKRITEELFGPQFKVSYTVEEGSIISRVTVVASIVANILLLLDRYGGVWEGIDRLERQAKWFGKTMNEIVVQNARTETLPPFHSEARRGIPGILKDFKDELIFLSQHTGSLPPDEISRRLQRLAERTDQLLDSIPNTEDRQALAREFVSIARAAEEKCPPLSPRPPKSPALLFRDELEQFLHNLAGR